MLSFPLQKMGKVKEVLFANLGNSGLVYQATRGLKQLHCNFKKVKLWSEIMVCIARLGTDHSFCNCALISKRPCQSACFQEYYILCTPA